MRLWSAAVMEVADQGGPNRIGDDALLAVLAPGHLWANGTTELFTGWLSGHVETAQLLADGARILAAYPEPETGEPGATG
jgi:hypothetical protein